MMKVGAIAINTFRETVRDRILYSILVFAIVMIGLSYFLAELSVGDLERVVINFGLACVQIFGAIIAIFIGINLVSKEIEKKTIYSIVSKPVTRFDFIMGKYSGLAITLFVTTLSMTAGLVLTCFLQSGHVNTGLFFASFMIYLELLLIISIALLFSSFTTPTLSAIFTLSIFVIGHLSQELRFFGEKSESVVTKGISLILYYFLPNLENFNFKNQAIYGMEVSSMRLMMIFLYFFAYTAFILFVTRFIFNRRDFK